MAKHIIILGAGDSGIKLATRLSDEHDVVLIDRDSEALEEAESLDILHLQGEGTSPIVLRRAGLDKADMMLAVSSSDRANLLACMFAKQAGVPVKVARIQETIPKDYEGFDLAEMGVDLLINEHEECARELYNVLRIPAAHIVVDTMEARALVVGILMPTDSPLLMCTLADCPEKELLARLRFIAVQRGGKVSIPQGDTQFAIGDTMYLLGDERAVGDFVEYACPSDKEFARIVIAGGGDIGYPLARFFEGNKRQVVIIEQDDDRSEFLSEQLEALVIRGDCLDQETLDEIGLNHRSAFVAVTGNDQDNMIACLLAERMGAKFTAARINRSQYSSVIKSSSLLDRAVNPHSSLINSIIHFVHGSHVKADTELPDLEGEFLEYEVSADHPWVGLLVRDIEMPKDTILAAMMSDDQLEVATGNSVFQAGARVALFALPKAVKKLNALFCER